MVGNLRVAKAFGILFASLCSCIESGYPENLETIFTLMQEI
jgi:hypothetical protein